MGIEDYEVDLADNYETEQLLGRRDREKELIEKIDYSKLTLLQCCIMLLSDIIILALIVYLISLLFRS
jgi:hypothetical protein